MNLQQLVDEFEGMISVIWNFLIGLVPKLIMGLFILLVGYLIARIVQSIVSRFIGYLDRVINRKLKSRLLQVNLSSSRTFIAKTFFWIIIFFFFALFTEIIGLPVITSWLAGLGEYLPNLLAGVVIIFFGMICFSESSSKSLMSMSSMLSIRSISSMSSILMISSSGVSFII